MVLDAGIPGKFPRGWRRVPQWALKSHIVEWGTKLLKEYPADKQRRIGRAIAGALQFSEEVVKDSMDVGELRDPVTKQLVKAPDVRCKVRALTGEILTLGREVKHIDGGGSPAGLRSRLVNEAAPQLRNYDVQDLYLIFSDAIVGDPERRNAFVAEVKGLVREMGSDFNRKWRATIVSEAGELVELVERPG